MDDLCRLQTFVESLQASTNLSTPVNKLHRISQTLFKVARSYYEKRRQGQHSAPLLLGNAGLEQVAANSVLLYSDDNPFDSAYDLGDLVYSQTDELFFGSQQVLGSLEFPL